MEAINSDIKMKSSCSDSDISCSLELGLIELRSLESQNKSKSEYGQDKFQNNYTLGFSFIFLSICGYTILSFCSKLLYKYNPQISSWDLVFVRGVVSLAFIMIKAKLNNLNLLGIKDQGIYLSIAVGLAFLCYWFGLVAYRYISVAKATVIIYSNPVIVIVFAYFLLKENVTKCDIISVILVVVGCYLITQNSESDESLDSNPLLGYIFAFASCVSMGISLVFLRIVNQKINHLIFIFYFFLLMVIQSVIIIAFTDLINIYNYGIIEMLLLFASAVGGIVGQVFCGLAYKNVEASKLSPFWNLEIVFLCILETILLEYKFAETDIIGGIMVISAIVLTVLSKS